MKDFKAKHNKSYYKNTDAWLNAVYRNNKTVIDKELGSLSAKKTPKAIFKQMVNEYIETGVSPTNAVKTIARSTLFTSVNERLKNNFYEGLKSERAAYKQFRELTKERGKYSKYDPKKLVWDKTDKVYIYDGSVIISFENSPFGIKVRSV